MTQIQLKTTNIDSFKNEKLDTQQICKSLHCKDVVEVHKDKNLALKLNID